MFKKLSVIILLAFTSSILIGQDTEPIAIVDKIIISGNKKTKKRIITRELDILVGDTILITEFEERFYKTKNRLLSTGLFNEVNIYFRNYSVKDQKCTLFIDLNENWYIYPAPIFELADRNFSVWWKEMNHSFSRVEYGLRVAHYNLTGNRDKLKLKLQSGYTRKYELEYRYPFLNKSQTLGLKTNIFFSDQKELPYITFGNKSLFAAAADERKLLSRFRTGTEFTYRPDLFFNHSFGIEYHQNMIDTLVSKSLNPDYFLDQRTSLQFFTLQYYLEINKRVFDVYPLGGYVVLFNIKKEGFGLFKDYNNLSTFLEVQKHFPTAPRTTTSFRLKAKANIMRNKVSFANNTGLGYGDDIISGYDLYVIDGTDYFLGESQIKYRLFDIKLPLKKWMPIHAFKNLNCTVFLRWNTDIGYVNERFFKDGNDLNNRWLIGYGPAIDFLFYNTFLFKFEYTFNQIGEQGLYLRSSNSF